MTQFSGKVSFTWLGLFGVVRVSREFGSEGSRPGAINAIQRRIDAAAGSNSTVNCIESYSEAERDSGTLICLSRLRDVDSSREL